MAENDPEKQFGGRLWYGEQDENGVDVSLIRSNLKLTPEERLLRSDQAAADALELMEYGRIASQKQASRNR